MTYNIFTSYNSIYFLLTIIHLSVKVVYNWLSAHHTIQQNFLPIQYNIVNNSNKKKKKKKTIEKV